MGTEHNYVMSQNISATTFKILILKKENLDFLL